MVRSQMNFKRLSLTDIKIDIKRIPKKKTLIAAMGAVDVKKKWEKSSWGRKLIVQKRRATLNDFDRFKLMLAKIKISFPLTDFLSNSPAKTSTSATPTATSPGEADKKRRHFSSISPRGCCREEATSGALSEEKKIIFFFFT
ncbi:60S ribosomal protein L14-2 [Striga hermonthica]|uniref:60S ribosomal protein L14-2 n=1 Tax=Striga hermonthica TaxID=68872 RepID=A0A9N7NGZ1_STRHE|nr:60S ribosomal protein L14-2 [Striga hermonthica]